VIYKGNKIVSAVKFWGMRGYYKCKHSFDGKTIWDIFTWRLNTRCEDSTKMYLGILSKKVVALETKYEM
jgi:hypothetical protein